MLEVVLIYPTPEGSQEIAFTGEKMSFGRGSEADYRFDDDGLSRLHSTIYRDGAKVWIVDENSTNGTFVNNQKSKGNGTPLRNGDAIKIGHHTILNLRITDRPALAAADIKNKARESVVSGSSKNFPVLITLAFAGFAVLIIVISIIVIGFQLSSGGNAAEIVYKDDTRRAAAKDYAGEEESEQSIAPRIENTTEPRSDKIDVDQDEDSVTLNSGDAIALPANKKYQAMSDDEKKSYIAAKAEKTARIIGNKKSEPIPASAVQEIKRYIDGYARRLAKAKNDNCSQSGWGASDFTTVLERASKNAPFIIRHFSAEGIDPQLGIYVAMIESEHCACLESPTRAKGMFQFLASSAPDYGLNPDDRCEPDAAARAAAKYLKSLIGRFGTAPDSVPLAIASYNSGQGNLSKNLDKVMAAAAEQNRSFWTLIANKNVMEGNAAKQFSSENIKYVPKFFATAIIGENPQDFGVNLQPLSTYTK